MPPQPDSPLPMPSLKDKLLFIPLLGRVVAAALTRALTLPITNTAKANRTFKDIAFAALRAQLAHISIAQEVLLNAKITTEETYLDFAKKPNFRPDTDVLPAGLKLHRLGPKTAEKTVLYFHEGGYKELAKTKATSIVIVAYTLTLTPGGQYPTQLKQAAESLDWLLNTIGRKPADIIFAGDSAGGNLTLGLLSHLLHPHPDISKIVLQEPLAAALLISAWIKFATTDDSWKRNATNIIVKDVLIWGGDKEVIIDSIEAMSRTLQQVHPGTELVVELDAAREDFIMDALLGYQEKATGTKVIEGWLASRLS
ncbi:Putative alpha/beta hydrolase-3, lipase, GDXG serine active [Septoria linicola]|uniref:Alpha/beta hydrolase-3, lipase, GDXG serine active n=1 Tax=Septoria linicola TaxID=215465 RepID=A0A9Q9APV7_9PEZI|nr:Putative alpha/beta hydrolase-3, lipase, GDXG serine active [Septoria linicola]